MKKIFSLLINCLSFSFVYAQVNFQKVYSDTIFQNGSINISGMIQTNDGGYAMISDIAWIGCGQIKTNSYGDIVWAKSIYSSLGEIRPKHIKQTTDGGYIIAGNIDLQSQNYTTDAFLIKTNSSGTITWAKKFGGMYSDFAGCVIETSNQEYVFCGTTLKSEIDVAPKMYIVKVNNTGALVWTKTYGDANYSYATNDIKQTSDGGYIISGCRADWVFAPASSTDIVLVKTNSLGTIMWAKKYGGTDQDIPIGVIQTNDGGFLIAGNTKSTNPQGGYLLRTNLNGNTAWLKTYSGVGFYSLHPYNNGSNYLISGESTDKMCLLKLNVLGDTLFSRTYKPAIAYYTVAEFAVNTSDGGMAVCGNISSPGDTSAIYFSKTNSNGISSCYTSHPSITVSAGTFTTTNLVLISSVQDTNSVFIATDSNIILAETDPCLLSTTDLKDERKDEMQIIPSLFSEVTTVYFNQYYNDITLSIVNMFGAEVKKITNVSSPAFFLQCGDISPGVYIVNTIFDGKTMATKKIVIAR